MSGWRRTAVAIFSASSGRNPGWISWRRSVMPFLSALPRLFSMLVKACVTTVTHMLVTTITTVRPSSTSMYFSIGSSWFRSIQSRREYTKNRDTVEFEGDRHIMQSVRWHCAAFLLASVLIVHAQEPRAGQAPASQKGAVGQPRSDLGRTFLAIGAAPDPAAVERGEKLYVPSCGFCHGTSAKG